MAGRRESCKKLILLALVIILAGFLFSRLNYNGRQKNQRLRNQLTDLFANSSIPEFREFDLHESDLLIMQGFAAFFPRIIEQLRGGYAKQTAKNSASALAPLILHSANKDISPDERDACLTAFFTYFPQNFPDPEAFADSIYLINRNLRDWRNGYVDIACKSAAQKIANEIILPLLLLDKNLSLDKFSRFFNLFPELRLAIEADLTPKPQNSASVSIIDESEEMSPASRAKEPKDEF